MVSRTRGQSRSLTKEAVVVVSDQVDALNLIVCAELSAVDSAANTTDPARDTAGTK